MRCTCSSFKTRAPRAIKAIRAFARRAMFTNDIRIDNSVNRYVYKQVRTFS
jgi:large subunit ribosomal protein L31e